MAPIDCFFLEPTKTVRLSLRRYVSKSECPGRFGYHNARVDIGEAPAIFSDKEGDETILALRPERNQIDDDDPRWPAKCDHCDHRFEGSEFNPQVAQDLIYRRTDTGALMTIREAPVGAMWHADWYWRKGPDGHVLAVKVPGGHGGEGHEWLVDGRASNCTKPDDNEHYCWNRVGEVPKITVDKRGPTCDAGAGSIRTPHWHGFLRNGQLVVC